MWRMEIGLALFWFIPLFLGFVVAFILLRFTYDKLNDGPSGERGHDTAKIDSQ